MSSVLSLDLLKAQPVVPLKCDAVAVPEFGAGTVAWLAELSAQEKEERIELPFSAHKEKTKQEHNVGLRCFVIAACLCKGQSREFEAKTAGDIAALAAILASKSAIPIARMMEKVEKLNALTDAEVEAIEKN